MPLQWCHLRARLLEVWPRWRDLCVGVAVGVGLEGPDGDGELVSGEEVEDELDTVKAVESENGMDESIGLPEAWLGPPGVPETKCGSRWSKF